MGRPREHDPEKIRRLALRCFWERGFANTSMSDLKTATGLDPSQFIRDYGSKSGVFIKALHDFGDITAKYILVDLESGDSGIGDIKKTLERIVGLSGEEARWGCLICNTSQDASLMTVEEIGHYVSSFFDRIEAGYSKALNRALSKGELNGSPDQIRKLSRSLMGTHISILILQRSGAESQVIADIASQAIDLLK